MQQCSLPSDGSKPPQKGQLQWLHRYLTVHPALHVILPLSQSVVKVNSTPCVLFEERGGSEKESAFRVGWGCAEPVGGEITTLLHSHNCSHERIEECSAYV